MNSKKEELIDLMNELNDESFNQTIINGKIDIFGKSFGKGKKDEIKLRQECEGEIIIQKIKDGYHIHTKRGFGAVLDGNKFEYSNTSCLVIELKSDKGYAEVYLNK